MPDRYPDYPHHTHIFEWLCDYADAFDAARAIRFNTRVERAERGPEGGWQITLDDGEQRALRRAARLQRPPLGPALPATSRAPSTGRRSTRTTTSTRATRSTSKASACSSSGSATAPWTSSPSSAARRCRDTVFLSTRSGAYVVPKYLFGKPADQVVKTNPRLPAGLQRRVGRLLPRIFSGRMEDFGLPTPNHNFLDAHPTVSSELLGRLGAGDAVAKGDVAELLGDRVRFADGCVERVDAIIYATGYNISFPFFDPDFLSRAGKRAAAVQADAQAGHRRPRVHRARPADPDDLPVLRAAVEARRALAERRLGAAARGRDGSGDPSRRGLPHRPLHRQAPPHDAARVVRLQARARTRARSRPGRRVRAPARRPGRSTARARRGARGRRSCPHERGRLRQRRRALRRRAPAAARATPSPTRTAGAPASCSRTASPAPSTRAFCPSPSASPRPGSTRSRSTTATSAPATASPASCSRSRASSRTTPRRSPSRARCEGVDPDRDRRVGLLLLRRARRRRWPSPTAAWPPSSRRCPAMDGAATLLNLAALRRRRRSSQGSTLAGLRDLAGSLRGRPPVMLPVVGPPGHARRR